MSEIVYYIVIILAFVGLYLYIKIDTDKDPHYRELAQFYGLSESNIEDIRRFFKENPQKLEEAEKLLKEKEERTYLYQESEKRKIIKERIFAYEYEEMLYQLYAPLAYKGVNGHWTTSLRGYEVEVLVEKIAQIKKISTDEAINLFEILVEHNLIYRFDNSYMLAPLLEANHSPKERKWNVVSDTDMNLDKWMTRHGY